MTTLTQTKPEINKYDVNVAKSFTAIGFNAGRRQHWAMTASGQRVWLEVDEYRAIDHGGIDAYIEKFCQPITPFSNHPDTEQDYIEYMTTGRVNA